MAYRVIITPQALHHLDMYVAYTTFKLKNGLAGRAILNDAKQSKICLSNVAGSIRICDNSLLATYGYRKYRFLKHPFIMVYRIVDNVVVVEGMYHELQDYETLFISEMNIK